MRPALKNFINRVCPEFLLRAAFKGRSILRNRQNISAPASDVFTNIYRTRGWVGESVSGWGSDETQTLSIRTRLPELLRTYSLRSLLDLPCGDFHWMRQVDLGEVDYVGADIVTELIEQNKLKYRSTFRQFRVLDLMIDELPPADLLLCRDCLIHFSFRDMRVAFKNILRSEIPYILVTNHPYLTRNYDIVTGDVRGINLQLQPFGFPKPIAVIPEDVSSDSSDLSPRRELALWRTQDLKFQD